ncbi:MAG: DUF1016 N-terminal domain-containing protein [Syntrophales bacterium]
MRTNFEIGRHIVAHEQQGEKRAAYGKEVLKMLAERLAAEFGGGFSMTNLKLMRQFYMLNDQRISQTASDLLPLNVICQALSDQLHSGKNQMSSGQATPDDRLFSPSWSHYVFLFGIKNPDEPASTKSRLPVKTGPCANSSANSTAVSTSAWPSVGTRRVFASWRGKGKSLATFFRVHYATVSRTVKKHEL